MTRSTAEELAALRATVEASMKHQEKAQEEAIAVRETVNGRLASIEIAQRDLLRRANDMEPIVNAVKKGKIQFTGALALLGVIGGVVWAMIVFAKEWILERMGI